MTDHTTGDDEYGPPLEAAYRHSRAWLHSLPERPVRPDLDVDGILARLTQELPDEGVDAASVVPVLRGGVRSDGVLSGGALSGGVFTAV